MPEQDREVWAVIKLSTFGNDDVTAKTLGNLAKQLRYSFGPVTLYVAAEHCPADVAEYMEELVEEGMVVELRHHDPADNRPNPSNAMIWQTGAVE